MKRRTARTAVPPMRQFPLRCPGMCWSPFSFLAGCFRRLLIRSSLVRFRRTETNAQTLKGLLRLLGEEALNRSSLTHPEVAVHNDSGSSQPHRICAECANIRSPRILGSDSRPRQQRGVGEKQVLPLRRAQGRKDKFSEDLWRSASASLPLAINSAMRAKSWYITRSFPIVAHTARIAACATCNGLEVLSGARKSIACAAAMASMASVLRVFSTTLFSLFAAVMPMETKSSLFPDVVIESTDAGCASTLFSLTSAAAVTCGTMKPEFIPAPGARNGGKPSLSAGVTMRSRRRSLMPASAPKEGERRV